ncbi:MAG: DF family (seleno)protein [Gaiellaceae bacterium]
MVEIITLAGCPNADAARELAHRVLAETGVEGEVRDVEVEDADDAVELRVLGSPTIRVDGRDVEPGADEGTEYVFACRIHRTSSRMAGIPDETWLRAALTAAA